MILDEVVANGEKALIYSGIHHAFTEYKQPLYNLNGEHRFNGYNDARMGNFIYKEIGKNVITIFLHSPWYSDQGFDEPMVSPVDGIIDAVMPEFSLDSRRIGFDVNDTPFGKLPGETSIYKHGYTDSLNNIVFALDMYCDGYIYQMPLSEYVLVTPIEDFVNEENIEQAKLWSSNPDLSIEDFNNAIKSGVNYITQLLSKFY